MKCHEDEKAESIRLHCFLPVLASFLNLEVVRKKRAVFVQTGERKNSRQVISKPKSNQDANRHREKSSGCRRRVEVEVKLAMMGSDGDCLSIDIPHVFCQLIVNLVARYE